MRRRVVLMGPVERELRRVADLQSIADGRFWMPNLMLNELRLLARRGFRISEFPWGHCCTVDDWSDAIEAAEALEL